MFIIMGWWKIYKNKKIYNENEIQKKIQQNGWKFNHLQLYFSSLTV